MAETTWTTKQITKIADGIGTVTEEDKIRVAVKENYESEGILGGILTQLKIMNLHLSLLTDTEIRKSDVE